ALELRRRRPPSCLRLVLVPRLRSGGLNRRGGACAARRSRYRLRQLPRLHLVVDLDARLRHTHLAVAGPRCTTTTGMSLGVAIAAGAAIGLALGILVSVTTDLPLAPEVGAVLGGLIGWLSRRNPG